MFFINLLNVKYSYIYMEYCVKNLPSKRQGLKPLKITSGLTSFCLSNAFIRFGVFAQVATNDNLESSSSS